LKICVEKSEQFSSEISKTLDEIQRVKQQFTEYNNDRVRNCLKENALLLKENKAFKQTAMDLETKLNEQQKGNEVLKETLMKTEGEKQELLKEVHSLQNKIQEKVEKR
jgi:chromosome segregation ATPase